MSEQRYEGRLELTWTNKHRRLLAHDDSSYEWVDPSDYRVAEVRLLHDVAQVGETYVDSARERDNLLIRGDALSALTSLIQLPEFAREYSGNVRLVYIDPPFNTGQTFHHYDDGLEHSVWLTMIRDRLEQIRALLAPNGSVWLQLDDVEAHRARCVLDEVFGPDNFVANVIWRKTHSRENRTDVSTIHENLIVYARDRVEWARSRNKLPPTKEVIDDYINLDDDPRGPWKRTPAHAKAEKGRRRSQYYTIFTPSGREVLPPEGRCWLYTEDRFKALVADGRVWFGRRGTGVPRIKKFLSEVDPGLVPTSIWSHDEVGTTGTAKQEIVDLFPGVTPFSTPKPEALLRRLIHIASDPGDVVLDCFLGSGTTAAVALKMRRRFVGVEWEPATVATFTLPRLQRVVLGEDPGGITADEGWTGGAGFRVLDVAPSMFEADAGRVYLADWAVGGALGEATAAQLGYEHEDEPPFCGRKGRTRLAVVDGLVNQDVVEVLAGQLNHDERMVVCGTSIDPAARSVLRELRPGSTMRKIPSSILSEYSMRRRSDLRDLLSWGDAVEAMSVTEGEA